MEKKLCVLYAVLPFCFFILLSCTKRNVNDDLNPGRIDSIPMEDDGSAIVMTNQAMNNLYNERAWQGIPSVEIVGPNHLLMTWYSGGKGEGSGNYVTVAESMDNARTWKKNALIIAPPGKEYRVFDPAIWKDAKGKVHLYWAQSKGMWDGKGGVWTSVLTFKTDTIIASKPIRQMAGVMLNKPTNISQTTFLMPVSYWRFHPSPEASSGAMVFQATYNTSSTGYAVSTAHPVKIPLDNSIRMFDEHDIVVIGVNKLLCLLRTTKGIYYSQSNDNGLTWTKGQPFTAVGPTIASRFHIAKLKSGNILLVLNASGTIRNNLKAFLSTDNAKTWTRSLLLDPRDNVSYPDAAFDNNGNIFVSYDRNRSTDKEINLAVFKESDFFTREPGQRLC